MRWAEHKSLWADCSSCDLCDRRKRVVLGRGALPAEVLFIGEAPGKVEDVFGIPFKGPAGSLLLDMVYRAWGGSKKFAMTNLIGCIPRGEDGRKVEEPPKYAIEACRERLIQFIEMAKPEYFVLVGKVPEKWVPLIYKPLPIDRTISIMHPAAILRANQALRPEAEKRTVAALRYLDQ